MAQLSDFLENAMINHIFRNTPYAQAQSIYLALYSTDPTDADIGTELTGGGYDRTAIVLDAPVNGSTQNNADIVFPVATSDWATITHVGIRDANTGGNLLMHKSLTVPVTVLNTNNFRIPSGQLTLTLN